MTKRPTVKTRCPAAAYAAPNERIVEFSGPGGAGGLISFRADDNGGLSVSPYRLDPQVKVLAPNMPTTVMQWADAAVKAKPFDPETGKGECYRDEQHGVRLIQNGVDRFTVVYGKSVKTSLTYAQAAAEMGAAIMHSVACDGDLDNRERDERR